MPSGCEPLGFGYLGRVGKGANGRQNKSLRARWCSRAAAVVRSCLISSTRRRRAQAVLLVAFSPFVAGRPGVRGCRWITLSSSVAG